MQVKTVLVPSRSLDRRRGAIPRTRRWLPYPVRRSMTALLVLLALLAAASAIAASASAQEDIGERGRAVFMKNGCHGCHAVGKMGSPIGPDLSRIGFKYRPEYVRQWLRDPSSVRDTAHMPKLELTEADIDVLARYLTSLR